MTGNVIIDTGPLVASLDRRDKFHSWAKSQFAAIRPPMLTCEAVITEACYLVRDLPGGIAVVLESLRCGMGTASFALEHEVSAIAALSAEFANVPMSLADACLVRMAELNGGYSVLTLDNDFRIYRMHRRHVIPTIMPAETH